MQDLTVSPSIALTNGSYRKESFGINGWAAGGVWGATAKMLTSLKNPSAHFEIADSIDHYFGESSTAMADGGQKVKLNIAGRHNAKTTMSYMDGHVSSIGVDDNNIPDKFLGSNWQEWPVN